MRFLLLPAAILLAACQTAEPGPQPALLEAPDAATRQQLSDIVARALNSRVTLSRNALTQSSTLVIDAPNPQRLETGGDRGMIRGEPDRFSLWLEEGECLLKHEQTQRQWVLKDALCVPAGT